MRQDQLDTQRQMMAIMNSSLKMQESVNLQLTSLTNLTQQLLHERKPLSQESSTSQTSSGTMIPRTINADSLNIHQLKQQVNHSGAFTNTFGGGKAP